MLCRSALAGAAVSVVLVSQDIADIGIVLV